MNKKEIQELIQKAQSGDEEAKLILVQNHMDLVWSVVHKFGHLEVEKDDLFQVQSKLAVVLKVIFIKFKR